MSDEEIINIVETEFKEKTLKLTQQYLDSHSPVYVGEKLKVERIDRDRGDEYVTVYVPIEAQEFYYAVVVDKQKKEFRGIYSESRYRIYFRATSDELSETDLISMTSLKPTKSWNKGSLRDNGKTNHIFSMIKFMPFNEPDEFETKLNHLLDFLETDREGIKKLVEKANGYIQVAIDMHKASGRGFGLEKETVERMNKMNLGIDFDIYLFGNDLS
ncbi:MAG: DUF4279 domain-containing protein [Bacteroidia bacterium]|nr:DUF4279 domain-containing protein [Bacteroidia bacterium]